MTKFTLFLLPATALLASCGNIADDKEMIAAFGDSCKQGFVSEGGPEELAQPFCDCSLAKAQEQELGPMDMLDQEKMTAIGEQCAEEMLSGME